MKEYKLSGWPELPVNYQHTAYQRMLHQMSHGFVPLAQLARASGLDRDSVRQFLGHLNVRGVLVEREHAAAPLAVSMANRSIAWIRRTLRPRPPRHL